MDEGPLERDEVTVMEVGINADQQGMVNAENGGATGDGGKFVDIPMDILDNMVVTRLKEELVKRGQKTNGKKKPKLIVRGLK